MWEQQWWGHPLTTWTVALGSALAGYALLRGALALVNARLQALARARPGGALEVLAAVVRATRSAVLWALALSVGARWLLESSTAHAWLGKMSYALLALQLALWMNRLVLTLLTRVAHADGAPRNPVIFGVLRWSAQLVVWVLLLLALLDNAGVNVNAFVASLGVGGVAVALAAQNVLGDLFASISIGLDKPFEVGEFIAFGSDSGTVTRVGIKSTRIQLLSGEEMALSNALLLQEKVHNYSRMPERRVVFPLRLAIDTPRATAQQVVDEVRAYLQQLPQLRFDRFHLIGFGDWALEFEGVYFMRDPGFAAHRDTQQQISLQIMALLERLQARLAVPVRALQEAPVRSA